MATRLSNLINRMGNYTPIYNTEEARKVAALEEAIRGVRRSINPPWTLQKGTLKSFSNVFTYATASDHLNLAYLDNQKTKDYPNKSRFIYTTLQEFWEDPTNRNQVAEIWDNGTKMLGVNNKDTELGETIIADTQSLTTPTWASSGDAGTLVLDSVVFKSNPNYSVRVPITNSAGSATVTTTLTTTLVDANYKRKWFFVAVYLDSAPTSMSLRFGASSTVYLSKTVTTQFDGRAFEADDWNVLAFDLNEADITGSQSTSFAYQAIIFTGAATGTYYIDTSFLRGWQLLDYWYYSNNNVKLTGSTNLNQQYFTTASSPSYDTADSLLGEDEWSDVVVYEASARLLADAKEQGLKNDVEQKRIEAWTNFFNKYPDLAPLMTQTYRRYETDFIDTNDLV